MSESMDKYMAAKQKMNEMKEEAKKVAQVAFRESALELFEKHPELESFSWSQYTPYFNDGDECIFGVNIDEPDINGVEGYDIHDGMEYERDENNKYVKVRKRDPHEFYSAMNDVSQFLRVFDSEDFKDMFGDHVRVTVTKTDVQIDEYDHE